MMMKRLLGKLRGELSCNEILEVLQSYLDGETDEETARNVSIHLAGCTNCCRESEVYQNIKTSLASRQKPVDADVMDALRSFSDQLMAEPAD